MPKYTFTRCAGYGQLGSDEGGLLVHTQKTAIGNDSIWQDQGRVGRVWQSTIQPCL